MQPISIRLLLALMVSLLSFSLISPPAARSATASSVVLLPSLVYSHPTLRVTTSRYYSFFASVVIVGEITNYSDTTVYDAGVPVELHYTYQIELVKAHAMLSAIAPGQRAPFLIYQESNAQRGAFEDYIVFDVATNMTGNRPYFPFTVVSHQVENGIARAVFGEIRNDVAPQIDATVVVTYYDATNHIVDAHSGTVPSIPPGATRPYNLSSIVYPPTFDHYVVQAQG
jgi:hypothetical protein